MSNGENAGVPRSNEPLDATMNLSPQTTEISEAFELGSSTITAEAKDALAALPYGTALLVVQRGPNAGARFLLDDESVTAGRDPQSSIFLDDVTVSRRHAEFLAVGGGFRVRDAGSLNGTYVNRERVDMADLQAGDEVQIGKYRMTYHPSRQVVDPGMAQGPEQAGL